MKTKVTVLEVHQIRYVVDTHDPEEAKAYVEHGLAEGTIKPGTLIQICMLPSELWKTEAVK